MQQTIESKVRAGLPVDHLAIENESHLHRGPATDSHFKLVVVSEAFAGMRPVARHQKIYSLLNEELAGSLHALVLHLYTPDEWAARQGDVPVSAPCSGAH